MNKGLTVTKVVFECEIYKEGYANRAEINSNKGCF